MIYFSGVSIMHGTITMKTGTILIIAIMGFKREGIHAKNNQ